MAASASSKNLPMPSLIRMTALLTAGALPTTATRLATLSAVHRQLSTSPELKHFLASVTPSTSSRICPPFSLTQSRMSLPPEAMAWLYSSTQDWPHCASRSWVSSLFRSGPTLFGPVISAARCASSSFRSCASASVAAWLACWALACALVAAFSAAVASRSDWVAMPRAVLAAFSAAVAAWRAAAASCSAVVAAELAAVASVWAWAEEPVAARASRLAWRSYSAVFASAVLAPAASDAAWAA